MKKICLVFVVSIFVFSSSKSKAVSFYSGLSVGESRAKIVDNSLDKKSAFTFSLGSSFQVPLFPFRVEAEYAQFTSEKHDLYHVKAYGAGLNAYVNVPLLPVLVPYVGFGVSYMTEKIHSLADDVYEKSGGRFIPQYIAGIDLDLPTVVFAGSLEYRYIDSNFKFDGDKRASIYNIFLVKARVKF